MSAPVGVVRRGLVAGWLLPLAPFVLAGAWTPVARALGVHADVPIAAVVAAGVLSTAATLVACGWLPRAPGIRSGTALGIGVVGAALAAGIGPALLLLAPLVGVLAVAATEVARRAEELLPPALDERPLRTRPLRAAAWTLVVALGTFQAGRVGSFLGDPTFVQGSLLPGRLRPGSRWRPWPRSAAPSRRPTCSRASCSCCS